MPNWITAARASDSATWLSVVRKTHWLPFSSAIDRGLAGRPASVKTVISICGNARRMASAFTIGRPISAAVATGTSVLSPPTSMDMMATGSLPRYEARASTEPTNSVPAGIFSRVTVGAPITAVVSTSASGGRSPGSVTRTGP